MFVTFLGEYNKNIGKSHQHDTEQKKPDKTGKTNPCS